MNAIIEQLFKEIRAGSANEQNDAIATLVEVLRKNYLTGTENYAFVFLSASNPLFSSRLSEEEKGEVIDELERLIYSEIRPAIKASLFWAFGSMIEWRSLEILLTVLLSSDSKFSDEETYQALCSLENLLCLDEDDHTRMRSLLVSNQIGQILKQNNDRERIGLVELITGIQRQVDRIISNEQA